MKWIRSNGKIDIITGRVYKEQLQTITKDGLVRYHLNTPFSLSGLTDIVVTGYIKDDGIDVKNIYPVTDDMQMAWDKEEGVRLFYTQNLPDEMHESGEYLYLTKKVEGKGCHLKIINKKQMPYNRSGYQVFITQKVQQEKYGPVYVVQQIH